MSKTDMLRKQVRQHAKQALGLSGLEIVKANADQCERWLAQVNFLGGEAPAPEPEAPAPTSAPTSAPAPAAPAPATALEQAIANAVSPFLQTQLDESRVIELIELHAKPQKTSTIRVQVGELPAKEISRQHYKFPALLACVAARVPAYLVGPAGSGKTSAASAAAKACGLSFGAISVGPMTSKSDLFGFIDAGGTYRETELIRAFRDGGVFLLDEIDAGNAGIMTQINMLAANSSLASPVGMIEKHPDFVLVAAANTFGTGASRQYVGRNQLDAATLDRFAFLEWDYDASLEASFVGIDMAPEPFELTGETVTPEQWFLMVSEARAKAQELGMRVVISPRATIYGVKLLAAGVALEHVSRWLIKKGLSEDEFGKLI